MRKEKRRHRGEHKNQLIAKPGEEKKARSVSIIIVIGAGLLFISMVWFIVLWWKIAPPMAWYFTHPRYMERADVLFEASHFGHAIIGPLELATLGTIILSFVHVIHQLRTQVHTEKTRFQPVVTCVALLDYMVEGTDRPEEKVKIANPSLKLRVKNLGDSPATFIEIEIKGFSLTPPGGHPESLYDDLKIRSIRIDSIGKQDVGVSGTAYEVELTSPNELSAKAAADIAALINGILRSENNPDPGVLELSLTVSHENVMGLEYICLGTFIWSRDLQDKQQSDPEQIDYIKNFRKARQGNEKKNNPNEKTTIGQFIKHSQPLQAAVKSYHRRRLAI